MKASVLSILVMLILFSSSSCVDEPVDVIENGMRPIYIMPNIDSIYAKSPQETENLGKIVYVDPYIFLNEKFKGIHVIDNNIPSNPENIVFWQIPGNVDFTIEGNYLYADNSLDLYTIDISDITDIEVVDVIEKVYGDLNVESFFPEDYFGRFECVNSELGIVIDWQLDSLVNPKCWR